MIYIIGTSHSRTGRIVAFAAACGLLAAGILAYSRIELAPLRYDVIGVDVSNHQGDIDWRALAGSGIGFAYIKATEGETFRDGRFPDNWAGAELAGVPRGAYHFFTRCRTGADQARNFIATVPRDAAALPHVVDAEQMGPCRSGPTVGDIPQEIDAFLAPVEAHHGRRPLIYTTAEFHDAHLVGRFSDERFWLRSLVIPPVLRNRPWVIWQYHNDGRRSGVTGSVDLDAFRGSRQDFADFARSGR